MSGTELPPILRVNDSLLQNYILIIHLIVEYLAKKKQSNINAISLLL